MGFLKRLFGGENRSTAGKDYVDTQGVYFYVRCDNCGTIVRVRADKQHDLNNENGGYAWHKTIVDNRCFRPMQTVVYLDGNYQMTSHEITGGQFVSEADYQAWLPENSGKLSESGKDPE